MLVETQSDNFTMYKGLEPTISKTLLWKSPSPRGTEVPPRDHRKFCIQLTGAGSTPVIRESKVASPWPPT